METLVAQEPASVCAIPPTAFRLSWYGRNKLTFERAHAISIDFVNDYPAAFIDAYFNFNWIKVYQ